jgi:hypothetical protein
MEGCCWHEQNVAYGCLTGLFVDPQHLEQLKEKEIEVVQGGFINEIDFHYREPEFTKFSWGTLNIPTMRKLAASFYSKLPRALHRAYLYLEYGSNKPALISHLWHGDDLVFGNKENSAFNYRYMLGNQVPLSSEDFGKTVTYALSIS